jgi:hypothetical protein
MLEKYSERWEFKDLYSLHLVGVIFSLFSKELQKEKEVVGIAELCFQ